MKKNDRSLIVYLVPHTHWDREWYLPRGEFSLMLVKIIDRLLDILATEPDYRCFMLDGQTIALEDYLSLKPEAEPEIAAYIREGRIVIGPWYVLPDEVLISGEAHIRNFLIGMNMCKRYGGGMQTGYLPDSFGHPSQMPQILKGLGMDELVFWRGLGPDIDTVEFTWKGFDGTEILGLNMPYSYGIGACLPQDAQAFLERISKAVSLLEPGVRSSAILFMNGVDHVAPERNLPSRIAWANSNGSEFCIVHASLADYVAEVRRTLDATDIPTATGELRSGYRAYLLGGTVSTRMYLKQANFAVERLLENQLEPILSVSALCGVQDYPASAMELLWRRALENLPHDSICGCSVDSVHRQMMNRFEDIEEIGHGLLADAMAVLGSALDMGHSEHEEIGKPILVFNPNGFDTADWVEAEIDINAVLARKVDHTEARLVEYDSEPCEIASRIVVADPDGCRQEAVILTSEVREAIACSIDDQPVMTRVQRLRIRFPVNSVPAVGYCLYTIHSAAPLETATHADGALELRNEWYHVKPSTDGSILVHDIETGVDYPGLVALVDEGDCGDEYTACPPEKDTVVRVDPESVHMSRESPNTIAVSGSLEIPRCLKADRMRRSDERVTCEFILRVTLFPGVRRVECTLEFKNGAEDHVLRVLFPTHIRTDRCEAEGTFAIDERMVIREESAQFNDWVEKPSNTHPHKGFVSCTDGEQRLVVFNRGLTEFRFSSGSTGSVIGLTLLRCVGFLSRDDISCRKGNAGWPLETPGAQCKGMHRFEFAFMFTSGKNDKTDIVEAARAYRYPPFARQLADPLDRQSVVKRGIFSPRRSFFRITGGAVYLSALKFAENRDGFIIRLVNPSAEPCDAVLILDEELASTVGSVWYCDLKEDPLDEPVKWTRGDVNISFRLHEGELKTLRLAV